jgi:hypothetical protein
LDGLKYFDFSNSVLGKTGLRKRWKAIRGPEARDQARPTPV